jgi:hypothetical protein
VLLVEAQQVQRAEQLAVLPEYCVEQQARL